MSAPPVYGPPNGQPQGYGPPQNFQPGPQQGQQPQYQGPAQYGPPAGQQGPPPQNYGPPNGQPGQPPASHSGIGSPTQQSEDASGFFTGGSGAPGLNFPKGEFGQWKGGIFTGKISTKQATTMRTATKPSEPRFWDSGDPIVDVVVEVLSPERDSNNPLDDGRRRMFITQENTHIEDSKASVTKEATRQGFHRGGQIYWCRVNQRQGKQNMRDVWECRYTPPTAETLAILDRMPPEGVSQQAANQVAAQASQGDQQANPYQAPPAQQGPPPQYPQGPPPNYNPQQGMYGPNGGPPPGQQPAYQGTPPPQQYQQAPAAQGYGPPAGQQGPPPQQYQQPQGQPVGYQQGPPQSDPNNPWAGQQGAPQQTQNPYYQQ